MCHKVTLPFVPLLAVVLAVFVTPAWAGEADKSRPARDVLSLSGVKAGLCVHVGCGSADSPALTAELASRSKMLVHGICWDTQALARARDAIAARNVLGQASAEKLSDGPLPYVRHLCNLVVVEDMKTAAAHGVGRDELMRILAPGGSLCVLEKGRWTQTTQSRPKGMDDWTHPHHGPDGNRVSTDRLARFPVGLRWIGSTAKSLNKWTGVRGWVLANGRSYIVTSSEIENLGLEEKPHFLVCRDAFNGLPLWKIPLATPETGGRLYWRNSSPLAADDQRVYVACKGKALIVDGATGKIEHTLKPAHQPERLLLLDKTLVLSCWKEREETRARFERRGLWGPDVNTAHGGSVEAYDSATGKRLWRRDHPAYSMLAADGVVYLLTRNANPATENHIIAVDVRTGKELWRKAHTALGKKADLQFDLAGPGFLAVSKRWEESLHILAAKTGKVLWSKQYGSDRPASGNDQTPYRFMSLVDGQLWYADKKLDPLTGKVVGQLPKGVPRKGITICVPPIVFGNVWGHSRRSKYLELPKAADSSVPIRTRMFHAARGACIQGMTPANGMLYTAQNNCQCEPGQVMGFLAFGPNGDPPDVKAFGSDRPVERGPGFARAQPAPLDPEAWPMQRANAQRNRRTAGAAPASLDILWQASVARPNSGPMKAAWDDRLAPRSTPPVAAGGRVFVATTERGQLKAFDLQSGKPAWTVTLGSRVDSAPTLIGNLCVIGVRDGWVYAFTADKGEWVWRTRVAPLERRIVVNGCVESTWPVVGSVLARDGKLIAHAGRSTEADGGLAIVQLDPATGKALWTGRAPPGPERLIDLLCVADDGTVVCNQTTITPGATIRQEKKNKANVASGPMLYAYLGQYGMRGYQASPGGRAMAGEKEVLATVLPEGGSVQLIQKGTTKAIQTLKLDSAPICDGVAIAEGKVLVVLEDGTLLCLGSKKITRRWPGPMGRDSCSPANSSKQL
ncbi:MAG: PQQ-binding-like beta-propeller repeat protein [Kiritimatiellia bacterium]|jgi:outer membrane protein assembly factor BamB|nr:PQQ-binding-like beta-propeller repeat protein [Kiritimatiellia bacterium]